MQYQFLTPVHQHICNMRGMILITATIVSQDQHRHCGEPAISLHPHHVSLVQWTTRLLPVMRDPGSIARGVLMWKRDSPVSVISLQHHDSQALQYQAGRMQHLPESIVVSEAGQVDEGYLVLVLSLRTCLQQLQHALAWLTWSIQYSGLTSCSVNMLCSPAAWSSRLAVG